MKQFLSIMILILNFQIHVIADDIRDFEIEGMSVGDNLLDHTKSLGVTKNYILKKKFTFYPASKRLGLLAFIDRGNYKTYYKVQFTVNPDDYQIHRIGGFIKVSDQKNCLEKQKNIISDLENSFQSYQKYEDDKFTPHPADKTGKSVANGIYLDLPSGDTALVECYFWSEEYRKKQGGGHEPNLRVTLSDKNANDFIDQEAY